jgi:hypothetical protein
MHDAFFVAIIGIGIVIPESLRIAVVLPGSSSDTSSDYVTIFSIVPVIISSSAFIIILVMITITSLV